MVAWLRGVGMTAVSLATSSSLASRAEKLLESVVCRRAETEAEREAIYRLRYEAYLRENAIRANLERRFTDAVDEQKNCWIIGLYIDGELASSIRLSVTIPGCIDLPALHVFSDLLLPEILAGKSIVDPTRFVADRAMSRLYPELPYITLRLPWMAMEYFQADWMLATVRAEHQAFYKRLWGNQVLCPPRPYPGLDKPISLMTCDFPAVRTQVLQRYPFFGSTFAERERLFSRTLDKKAFPQHRLPPERQPVPLRA